MNDKQLKIIVCGGRTYGEMPGEAQYLFSILDDINKRDGVGLVIEGGALGADRYAHLWADTRKITVRTFHANWEQFGKGAGHLRNREMLIRGQPDLVVAFPGGPGTANMIAQTKLRNVRLLEVATL